jgi:hypothetical protein
MIERHRAFSQYLEDLGSNKPVHGSLIEMYRRAFYAGWATSARASTWTQVRRLFGHFDWDGDGPPAPTAADESMTTPGLCEACLSCARARSLDVVYVYPSGHMLRPADIPGLSEWPARRGLTTFCGLPITGKEASRLYDLTR